MDSTLELWSRYLPELLRGTLTTIELLVVSSLGGVLIGLVCAFVLLSGNASLRLLVRVYVETIRGTPALVQLFIIYYGLGEAGFALPPFTAASIALALFAGAFFTEIFRGSISSIPIGQSEAAQAVGMDRRRLMRYIVLPQASIVALPPSMNMVADLLKATALLVTIGAPDLMYATSDAVSETYRSMELYTLAGLIYLAIALPIAGAAGRIERLASRYRG